MSVLRENVEMDELTLGKIVKAVAKNIALHTNNSMDAMVITPDGRMAVGCHTVMAWRSSLLMVSTSRKF